MIKLIDHRAWLFVVVYATLLVALGFPWLQQLAAIHAPRLTGPLQVLAAQPRVVAFIISVVGGAFLIKPVWRAFWRFPIVGRFLSDKIFPDLNGEWDIEIRSNWPIVDAMRQAAENPDRPRANAIEGRPNLSTVRLRGVISQGWLGANLEVRPTDATPLRVSRTLSFDFLHATGEDPKRVAWVFRQQNREVVPTDESNFLGSALLEVESADHLVGTYWNNRSWRAGLNVAGEIEMRRRVP